MSIVRTMYLKCLYYVCVCTMFSVFVLCLLCLYYVYCVCTMFMCLYYVYVFVLCLLCLYYVYCVCTMFMCLYYVYCVCAMFMCLYCVYHLTTGLLDLDAGRLARSQNPEGPATGHLDPGSLGFPGS